MDIINRNSYSNIINLAIVVNVDTNQDPAGEYRVQIYIPSSQYEFNNIYETYMNSSSKNNNDDSSKFPWAKSLVKDLKVGNVVYCSNINNSDSEYIILGLDAYNPKNQQTTDSAYNANGTDLLSLAMPIIVHNEVGIDVSAWPDGISDSNYKRILGNDNGAWSIGLIQWNASRAYDLLLKISNNDTNWKFAWTRTDFSLYQDLSTNSSSARSKYGKGFTIAEGSDLYNCIQNMLGSDSAKSTQRDYASEDTQNSISTVQEKGVSNPMITIFLVDIMNQYGSNLPSTISNAASISSNGGDIKSQFDEFVSYCQNNLGSYNTYKSRRDTTKTYVEQLYEQGKFSSGGLAGNLGATSSAGFIFPVAGCSKDNINNKTYPSYKGHTGVDVNRGVQEGVSQIVAVAAGKVIQSVALKNSNGTYRSYGEYVVIDHQNGLCTAYCHMYPNSRKVATGETVQQGQILGLLGTTGNSSGPHLHFEVRLGSNQTSNGNATNPLPYLP